MIFAIAAPVLLLFIGVSIDLTRQQVARSAAQISVDAAILAAAASGVRELDGMEAIVDGYLAANTASGGPRVNDGYVVELTQVSTTQIKVTLLGEIDTLLGGIVGIDTMPIYAEATAERGAADAVELVMVLDNTWSMSASAGGASRIDALKASARILVNALMTEDVENVRIGIVPYAEYVNVGTGNRGAAWLSVPDDYSSTSTPNPRVCVKVPKTNRVCTGGVWNAKCIRFRDGLPEEYGCWTTPQTCNNVPVVPEVLVDSCTGGGNPVVTWYRWYGCVYSRKTGKLRLDDTLPDSKYTGFLGTSQTCLNPAQPLTNHKTTVLNSIDGLIINVGSYKPETHIPSGLIWGVNLLSPTAPFTEGAAYSVGNRTPQKILVLMTDGENTLRFNSGDGRHLTLSTTAATAATQKAATDKDTADICVYAKAQGIEIYTVALSVGSQTARTMLETCASAPGNYFDATDSSSLEAAFAGIAASINAVRLVR